MSKLEQVEMPLFTKTFDFVAWLTPATSHFPRVHRQTITARLLNAALDFQECILEANSLRGANRLARLQLADGHLSKVRLYLRLAYRSQPRSAFLKKGRKIDRG